MQIILNLSNSYLNARFNIILLIKADKTSKQNSKYLEKVLIYQINTISITNALSQEEFPFINKLM
jgi:hypothetical protein